VLVEVQAAIVCHPYLRAIFTPVIPVFRGLLPAPSGVTFQLGLGHFEPIERPGKPDCGSPWVYFGANREYGLGNALDAGPNALSKLDSAGDIATGYVGPSHGQLCDGAQFMRPMSGVSTGPFFRIVAPVGHPAPGLGGLPHHQNPPGN
jgi:hypothetical protein